MVSPHILPSLSTYPFNLHFIEFIYCHDQFSKVAIIQNFHKYNPLINSICSWRWLVNPLLVLNVLPSREEHLHTFSLPSPTLTHEKIYRSTYTLTWYNHNLASSLINIDLNLKHPLTVIHSAINTTPTTPYLPNHLPLFSFPISQSPHIALQWLKFHWNYWHESHHWPGAIAFWWRDP
jgi:hypothetical protein